jgi:beta-aspartyl-dipeptidase (metallo-type)
MKLFKNVDLYTPEHLGKRDVLVEGEKIAKIAKSITEYDGIADVEIFDLAGKVMVPGYIDNHVHITGGHVRPRLV